MKKTANVITIIRIIMAAVMIFTKSLSIAFLICYTICGISDAIDGTVARKTGSVSNSGAVLDSIADVVFMVIAVIKLLPDMLEIIPEYIYWLTAAVFIIRITAYIYGSVKYRKLSQLHTYMNKLTGLCLFSIPYIMLSEVTDMLLVGICIISVISSVEELYIQIRSKKYNPDIKVFTELK